MQSKNKTIATTARTREILNTYNLRAKKNFGQNFLVDASVTGRMASTLRDDGVVIEVGPGIGSLTEELAKRAKHVRSYEIDERLIPVLEDTLKDYDNVEIVLQDILETDINKELQSLADKYKHIEFAANLPYYITTPVLFKLFESSIPFEKIVVMIQKEVADRFSAKPGTKEYGALSVESQYLYDVKKLFNVPRTSFNPAPNVDSAVISFTKHEKNKTVDNEKLFFELVKACFKQRRKTLYNNLREYFDSKEKAESLLLKANIPLETRAEMLDLNQYIELYKALKEIITNER
ncbi:MAG: 16S rRNA (adenine(1518)-N(6)/adenine(1519)-N(6))-dimethyltransferase RsmA [Erysipelotrichaceae bacterium]|nr:16S rRNA (adenine(1518)-N(6)/adenine(1519)-N(6))-dimethyltransferase RsmA [Erysipelotrichaceae bacterium]